MNNKELLGVKGFSVYLFGRGRQLEISTPDGQQFRFAISENLVEPLRDSLQNPFPNLDAGNSGPNPVSGILSGR